MTEIKNARRIVTFEVVGIAQPKGSTKSFGYIPKNKNGEPIRNRQGNPLIRTVTSTDNPKSKGWQQLVAEQAQRVAGGGLFLGPVTLRLLFWLPRPVSLPRRVLFHVKKPDLDKLIRATNDALTGILYRDDSQVVEIVARKDYARAGTAPVALIQLYDYIEPELVAGSLFHELPAASPAAEGRYTAWLMERPDPADGLPQYWNGFHADSFTKDPWQAIQYARKTDALTAGHRMLYTPFGWTLVEHMFIGTESGSAEGRAALDHAARLLALRGTRA